MKKILSFILIGAICLGLVACSENTEEKTIDEALNGGKDISADEDNDIFNLIDSMYEGDE